MRVRQHVSLSFFIYKQNRRLENVSFIFHKNINIHKLVEKEKKQ